MSQHLFNRVWAVSIGLPGKLGKKYTGLRTVFDIDKTSTTSSNKAKIEVYNFNTQSRLNYQKGFQIQLQAGYTGLNGDTPILETIYLGDIPQGPKGCISSRKGSSILTTFECGDAERQLVYGHFDQSYPPGTKYITVIQDLANEMNVDLGTVIGIQDQAFSTGYAATGSIASQLTKLLKNQKLEWHIQNGYLQILPLGAHNGDTAVILSNQKGPGKPGLTGLIGVPSQGDGFITFEALLNGKLLPGAPVQIFSETINGFFKIRRSHFEGDSHGDKWQVTCEGVAINASQTYSQQNLNGFFSLTGSRTA